MKKMKKDPSISSNMEMGMRNLYNAYDKHYGKMDKQNNKSDDIDNDIGSILLKTQDGRDIKLDSDEALQLILHMPKNVFKIIKI